MLHLREELENLDNRKNIALTILRWRAPSAGMIEYSIIEGNSSRKSNVGMKIGNCCHSNYWGRGLVILEDGKIRNNRVALLDGTARLFVRIADFSKLG
jgi:hypothetical protein